MTLGMTLGPALIYYPVWHPDFYGGPVAYRRVPGLCWYWPLVAYRDVPFKHREPELFEAMRAVQEAIDNLKRIGAARWHGHQS